MEQKTMQIKVTKSDADAILLAYKQHLAGKPVAELNLDEWQEEIFNNLLKRVTSGKTGTQISWETGYNATICCDFRSLKQKFDRRMKESKNCSTNAGIAAAQHLQREFGINISEQQQKDFAEILRMTLAGEKTSRAPLATVVKVKKFLKMYSKKATVKEMAVTLGITEKYILEMRKIKRESEKSLVKMV